MLAHLIGDYILQTQWMAENKVKSWIAAAVHALTYSLPFLLFFDLSELAFFTIFLTHMAIDRYRLARYVVYVKNVIQQPSLKWKDCSQTGYPSSMPPWLAVWLLIIADNTIHLCINYVAIRWL